MNANRRELNLEGAVSSRAEAVRVRPMGFTLIELLVVMAIMAFLMVMAIPSFMSLAKRGVNAAVTPLVSTLRLARQYAVTHRTCVWVVFPTASMNYAADPTQVTKTFRSYAVIATNKTTDGYEYISDWKYLPEGVYFGTNDNSSYRSFTESYSSWTDTQFPFPGDKDPSQRMIALMFKPNGGIYRWDDSNLEWKYATEYYIPLCQGFAGVNTNDGSFYSMAYIEAGISNITAIRVKGRIGQAEVLYDVGNYPYTP